MPSPAPDPEEVAPVDRRVAAELGERGYAIVPGFLAADEVAPLARELHRAWERGDFRRAGVGRGESFRLEPDVRSDHVLWLEEEGASRAQRRYLERMERLRLALNRELYLGLFGFEAHFALYPPGAFYKAHLDRFRSAPHRAVTTTLYLNEAWGADDGGELRLYLGERAEEPFLDVAPLAGTLAVFSSERFLHEVLPARRDRAAITGWLTRRP